MKGENIKTGGGVNMSDAQTDARQRRLGDIGDRTLERLSRLPLKDRLTVCTVILASVVMEIEESQQLAVLDGLMDGIRLHVATGDME